MAIYSLTSLSLRNLPRAEYELLYSCVTEGHYCCKAVTSTEWQSSEGNAANAGVGMGIV